MTQTLPNRSNITATKPESKQIGSECKHFARRGGVPAARLKTRRARVGRRVGCTSHDVPVARRKTRWSARRETRRVSAPERAESARRCARGKRVGARGARVSERAEHARRCACSQPTDPAFLLGRPLAERSRRQGPLEWAGAASRGKPAVSPRRCTAFSSPLEAYSRK